MSSFQNRLFREAGLLQNTYPRLPMIFDIVNVKKSPWVPPLPMLINPSTLERNSAKIVTTQKTRNAWVEYHWGDELDTLSATGSTGSFVLPFAGLASGSKTPISRTLTLSYLNFMNILDIYRSNGAVYDDYGAVVRQGNIRLFYDLTQYLGYFTEFSYSDSDQRPYRFNISFTFKVQRTLTTLSPGSLV